MLRVHIIDDRRTNRSILTKLAHSLELNLEVMDFADPASALAEAEFYVPDLVITDYRMPEMTGAEFVEQFRHLPGCSDVPVVVVTAYENLEYRYDALRSGATDFLLTPLDRVEFCARVNNLLTLRRQQKLIRRRAHVLEQRLSARARLHEQELYESEKQLRLVVDTVQAMVIAADPQGRCMFINRDAGLFFGLDPDAVVGQSMELVFGQSYADHHYALNAEVIKRAAAHTGVEERVADSDGNQRTFHTTKAPLNRTDGTVATIVTVSVDISRRKEMERYLEEARDQAEAANRAKNHFLANMSHDLRTPLNAVIGFAQMISEMIAGPIDNRRYVEYALDIQKSGRYLLELVDQMLEASQFETVGSDLRSETCDIASLVQAARSLVVFDADQENIRIDVDVPSSLPPVTGDPTRLTQAFVNFLSNAVKFSHSGTRVYVGVVCPGDEVGVVFRDEGVGMSEADIAEARIRFRRVENAYTSKRGGLGLGLPLAIEVIEAHGGCVEIESEPGVGTCVRARLPATKDGLENESEPGHPNRGMNPS